MVLDGGKSATRSRTVWVIVDANGTLLTKDSNPEFGNITQINSHRAENFGLLEAFTFLVEYCWFYRLTLTLEVRYYCDNQEVINKLTELREDTKRYDKIIRTIDHDTILALKQIMPPKLKIGHVKDHTERKTKEYQLKIPEQLKIKADLLLLKSEKLCTIVAKIAPRTHNLYFYLHVD